MGSLTGCTIDVNFTDLSKDLPSLTTSFDNNSHAFRSLYPRDRRVFNTATVLNNGKILVVGGMSLNSNLATLTSAEIFDPVTSKWSDAAPMTNRRGRHTATLLPSGKVLIVGGSSLNTYVGDAVLYDPDDNTWSSAGSLAIARDSHSATLLNDGRVLIAGGSTAAGYTNSMEVYDPSNNTWATLSTTLPQTRSGHAAVKLQNGKIFFVGGGNTSLHTATAIFDPTTETWAGVTPSLASGRSNLTATLLADGKVAVLGGASFTGTPYPELYLFNPDSPAAFASGAPLSAGRYNHTATLANGVLIVTGGQNSYSTFYQDTLIYIPHADAWKTIATLKNGNRAMHTASISGDYLFLLNGVTETSSPVNMAEKLDLSKMLWNRAANMSIDRAVHTTTVLQNGKILAAGGVSNPSASGSIQFLSSTEIFDASTGQWSAGPALPFKRWRATATRLADGKVLVAGGLDENQALMSSTAIYNPTTNLWSIGPSINFPRALHSMVLLPDGKVMLFGGTTNPGVTTPTAKTEIYDPATNQWTLGPDMSTAVAEQTATVLADNRILVVGGLTAGGTYSSTVQIYDHSTATWTAKTSLTTARYQHSATLLPSGKVLVAGGITTGFTILSSTEIYDVTANTWTAGPTLAVARRAHLSVTLPSGKVLLTGGSLDTTTGIAGDMSQIYDPNTNTWSMDSVFMATSHALSSLIKLSDGKIVAIGGTDPNYHTAITETYRESAPTEIVWTSNNALLGGRAAHTATLMDNGKIIYAGGQLLAEAAAQTNTTSIYDTTTNTWIAGPNMSEARIYHTSTLLPSGKVFIAGGFTATGYSATADIYNPITNTFSTIALPHSRIYHSAVMLPDGRLLLTGGLNDLGAVVANDVYDPTDGTWSTLADRPMGALEMAFPFGTDKFVFLGAFGNYIYDTVTDTWTAASPSTARMYGVGIALASGKILVAGGQDINTGTFLATAGLYDPQTDSWTPVPDLDTPLAGITASLLPSGKVALIGGSQDFASGIAEAKVRIYDPATNQWSLSTPITESHFLHTATTLPNGKIFIYGGSNLNFGMLPFWETIEE
ncbi:MAG: hypothetical protein J7501_11825 [Bdellovibrio sp.]|nr:hypothetical protein [Bdellovibrio sp.]